MLLPQWKRVQTRQNVENVARGSHQLFAAGYLRVAGFRNRYTNRSRHTGTAIEPTNRAAAIKCKSMSVVSPEATIPD